MSTQRVIQLLLSFVVLAIVALLSERSRALAAIAAVMPLKVTIALFFVFTDTGGDRVLSADFCRVALLALIPTAMYLLACWLGLSKSWPLGWVVAVAYASWLLSLGVYRGIEWWLRRGM
jgi:uncharacterized membrane protein (GlpM family)